jgi:hypothetical protein
VDVHGSFSHLRGVHNADGYLYRVGLPAIVGGFDAQPSAAGLPLIFRTPETALALALMPGATYAYLDCYWQPYHLDMVLAGPAAWQLRTMSATAAHFFRQHGVTGWQPVGAPLPPDAEDLGIRDGAWDHEHCELCRGQIGRCAAPAGYVDSDDRWLCVSCFERYAAVGDVSFAAEV